MKRDALMDLSELKSAWDYVFEGGWKKAKDKDEEANISLGLASRLLEHIRVITLDNGRLRAALATSKDPCVYCQLPAEEMAKCKAGFPGCARMDDLTGCPEFGAAMELEEARAVLGELVALKNIKDSGKPFDPADEYAARKPKAWAAARAFAEVTK